MTAKKTIWSRLVPVVVVLVGVVLVLAVYKMPTPPEEKKVIETPPVNVVVEPVRNLAEVEETFDLPGTVEPNRVVKVAAEVAGRIESYGQRSQEVRWQGRTFAQGEMIDEGQPVDQGDVLVQLNRDILEAERDRTEAQSRWEQSEHERLVGLQGRGATTAREVNEAGTKAAVSRAALKAAEEQLNRTTIRSPIRGVLNRMMREVGEYVMPGMEIAEIVDVDPVKVVVDIPERDVRHLAVGQTEQILLDKDTDPIATGRITYISSLADPQTRSSRVEITIPNPEHHLRSGQIVRVRLTRGVRRDVVMIPLKAVIPLEQGYEVFVARDGVAEARNVKLGFIRQDRVLVEGLKEGEQLITQGHRLVGQGQRVKASLSAASLAGTVDPSVRAEAGTRSAESSAPAAADVR